MKKIAKAGIGLAAVAAVAATSTLVAFAVWGPSPRPTYTLEKPADHVVFNSITNNNLEIGYLQFGHLNLK